MEKYVIVDGLKTRYLEEGVGAVVLLLHGANLGRSADDYDKNIGTIASAGLRVIAYDSPGYGLTDNPRDYTTAYRSKFIVKFIDTLGLDKVSIVGHSATGRNAAHVALNHPERVAKVVALASTDLLPPLPDQPPEWFQPETRPPTLDIARNLLEKDLFNKAVITEDIVQRRYRMSLGKNYEAALERAKERAKEAEEAKKKSEDVPLWKKFAKSSVPKLYLFGKEDRESVVTRCSLLITLEPDLNVQLLERCCHMVMLDAAEEFNRRVIEFLSR